MMLFACIRKVAPLFCAAAACLVPASALALIDLELRPNTQVATVGSMVRVDLYAVSDNKNDQSISAMDVILLWDASRLKLLGFSNTGNPYNWFQSGWLLPGGLNSSHLDGDAIWTAFAQPGNPAFATPSGLKVTTFIFEALTTTPVSIIAIPEEREGYMTVVYSGDGPNMDVTGELGEASVQIVSDVFVPTTYSIFRGIYVSGDLASLYASDDDRLSVRPGLVLSSAEEPVQVVLESQAPTETVTELRFILEASTTATNISQRLELFNFVTNSYESVDFRPATTTDSVVEVVFTSNPSRFVQAGTRTIRARVKWRQTGPVISFPWQARIDQSIWKIKT